MHKSSSYDILEQKLNAFIRKYYQNILIRGVILFVALVSFLFLSANIYEYFAYSGTLIRGILFYSILLLILLVAIRMIVRPILKIMGIGKTLSYEEAASIIGKHFPEIDDKLLNTLQLQQQLNDEHNPSIALLNASIDKKTDEMKPFSFPSVVNFNNNKKYIKYLLIPLLLIAFIFFYNPSVFTESTTRIVNYTTHYEKPAPYNFSVTPNSLQTIQGEDYQITVSVDGEELPNEVFVEYNNKNYRLTKQDPSTHTYVFKNIQKNTTFNIHTAEVHSRNYTLKVYPKPVMLNFSIELTYPAYISKPNELINNNGNINVPRGTKATWKFYAKNTDTVGMKIGEKEYRLQLEYSAFSKTIVLMDNVDYTLYNKNQYITNADSMNFSVHIIPDNYPDIDVASAIDSVFSDKIYFKGVISDDYGFTELDFVYTTSNSDNNTSEKRISIPIEKNNTKQDFYYSFDARALNLKVGEGIDYYFEVFDNDAVSGYKSAKSAKLEYRLPTAEEVEKKVEQQNASIKSDINQLTQDANKLLKDIQELSKKLVEKDKPTWEEKNRLEQLLKKYEDIQKNIEELKNENLKNNFEENKYKEMSAELLEKQKALEKKFDELFSEEMKQLLRERDKMMMNLNKDKINQTLQKMKISMEDMNKELDRNMELFKELELEKKFEDAIKKSHDLAEEQRKLAEEIERADKMNAEEKNNLLRKQENIEEKFKDLQQDLRQLENLNKQLESPQNLKKTDENENAVQQKMNAGKEQLNKKNNSKSAKSLKDAADEMEKLSLKLEEEMYENEEQDLSEDIESLRQILKNLITVSFTQEQLMNAYKSINAMDPKVVKIAQDQHRLIDNMQGIEDSLMGIAKRQVQVSSFISREVTQIKNSMANVVIELENRNRGRVQTHQQTAMTSVNNLALLLAESMNEMKEQQKQAANNKSQCKGGKSCKNGKASKPGGKKKNNGKQMQSLRKLQEQLNKQMQSMKNQMDGKQQQGMQNNQSISEQFARMAAQQAAIRKMLQDMQSELKKEGQGYEAGLEQLKREMEKTEKELVNKQITNQTLNRQKNIMTRLLESEKAEMEREKSEERKSTEAQNIPQSNPPALFDEKQAKNKEVELYKTVPPSLNFFYKEKVNTYFYNCQKEIN